MKSNSEQRNISMSLLLPNGLRAVFCREKLPDPAAYYRAQGLVLIGSGQWRTALCPFHADHHPSLRINVESGGFRCMACGAHGGDVLAFHRSRHSMSFINAVLALRAWRKRDDTDN